MISNPILLLIIGPIVSGIICLPLPDRLKGITKSIAGIISAACLAGGIFIFIEKPLVWKYMDQIIFRADNLSSFIGTAMTLFTFLITIFSFGSTDKAFGRYFGYMLITLGASLGALFANNLIIMLIFWGFLALMLYLFINLDQTVCSAKASSKALIIIGGTDVLMLFGIALVSAITGTLSMDKIQIPIAGIMTYVAYFSIASASFAKAGAMPFHSWFPDVAETTSGSFLAYLPTSLDKLLGIYLLARVSLDLFKMTKISNTILLIAGAATIIFAVVLALAQRNYKKLLAYTSISQVGYMIIGIASGTVIGIAGGLFHMLNHVIYKACLFLTSTAVEKKAGTSDLDRLGGLAGAMPITFAACLIASLSICGIPPFNGFVSKWMIYQGIIESADQGGKLWVIWLSAAMFGGALTIACFMKLLHAVFLGRRSEGMSEVKEVGPLMYMPMLILAAICVIFGVFAFKIPIPILILPSIGNSLTYIGTWGSTLAALLILVGIAIGALMYWLFRPGSFRVVDNFVGGADPESLPRVSGMEFYDTITDIKPINRICKQAQSGWLDIYYLSARAIKVLARPLKRLHNGVLPTYLVWCFLGMIAMLLFLSLR